MSNNDPPPPTELWDAFRSYWRGHYNYTNPPYFRTAAKAWSELVEPPYYARGHMAAVLHFRPTCMDYERAFVTQSKLNRNQTKVRITPNFAQFYYWMMDGNIKAPRMLGTHQLKPETLKDE